MDNGLELLRWYLEHNSAQYVQFRNETGERCEVTQVIEYSDKWYIEYDYMDKQHFSGEYLAK